MPLLVRIVIAAAMLTSGWVNCFSQVEIRSSIAQGLQAMEIEVNTPAIEDVADSTLEESDEAVAPTSINATTRGVHRIAWLLDNTWPYLGGWGIFIAWAAAVSQLVAGVLLLAGLFTRLAALTICVATGTAIYLVSGGMHGMFTMNPFEWPHDSHQFIQLFAGFGLFTLSLGLLFGGGGGFSLDARHKKTEPSKKNNGTKNGTPQIWSK